MQALDSAVSVDPVAPDPGAARAGRRLWLRSQRSIVEAGLGRAEFAPRDQIALQIPECGFLALQIWHLEVHQ